MNCMGHSPSLEADSHTTSQEILPDGSLTCSQESTTGSYPEPDLSSAKFPTIFP